MDSSAAMQVAPPPARGNSVGSVAQTRSFVDAGPPVAGSSFLTAAHGPRSPVLSRASSHSRANGTATDVSQPAAGSEANMVRKTAPNGKVGAVTNGAARPDSPSAQAAANGKLEPAIHHVRGEHSPSHALAAAQRAASQAPLHRESHEQMSGSAGFAHAFQHQPSSSLSLDGSIHSTSESPQSKETDTTQYLDEDLYLKDNVAPRIRQGIGSYSNEEGTIDLDTGTDDTLRRTGSNPLYSAVVADSAATDGARPGTSKQGASKGDRHDDEGHDENATKGTTNGHSRSQPATNGGSARPNSGGMEAAAVRDVDSTQHEQKEGIHGAMHEAATQGADSQGTARPEHAEKAARVATEETSKEHKTEPSVSRRTRSTSRRAAAAAAATLSDDVLVGTRVSEGHENFVTAYNMLTGIRVAVSRCSAKNNRPLTDADFRATEEVSFDLSGGGYSPSSKYIFQFKDYAPWVFRHLRDVFRLDPADYLMSLTAKYIVSELGSPGKSGSFFYYSRDYRFIIKTIRHSEHKLLRRVLRQYYGHVKDNPSTLISQFYGLHRVRLPFGRKIHFVVMNNVFPALYEIHEMYDLKGSMIGREYQPNPQKPVVVYKDLDWLRKHRRVIVGPEKRARLINQLEIDTRFLERINVMDYSLLVGIHDMRKGNAALRSLLRLKQFGPKGGETTTEAEKQRAADAAHGHGPPPPGSKAAQHEFTELQRMLQRASPETLKEFNFADEYRSDFYFYHDHGGFQSTDDHNENLDVIYYIGIIDFLTGYTFRKSVETFCKGLIHDRRELSAVPAAEYGERFLKFLRGSIGPEIKSSKPHKRGTDRSTLTTASQSAPAEKTTAADQQQHLPTSASLSSPTQTETPIVTAPTTPIMASYDSPKQAHPTLDPGHFDASHTTPPPRSPSLDVTAVTSDGASRVTSVRPAASPESARRPSVAGYGPKVSTKEE